MSLVSSPYALAKPRGEGDTEQQVTHLGRAKITFNSHIQLHKYTPYIVFRQMIVFVAANCGKVAQFNRTHNNLGIGSINILATISTNHAVGPPIIYILKLELKLSNLDWIIL